ncbi:hypothetical protein ACWEHA_00385 [Amycolatopsis nivea]
MTEPRNPAAPAEDRLAKRMPPRGYRPSSSEAEPDTAPTGTGAGSPTSPASHESADTGQQPQE